MARVIMIAVGLVAAGAVAYGLVAVRNRPLPSGSPGMGEPLRLAPHFALQDYQGNTITLSQFRGKPVVVNAWAAWCPFCREELKDFAAVQEEFAGQVVIIAVDRAESRETAKRYSDELGVTGKLVFLLDPGDSFYRSIGGFSMPETIFVDAAGNIRDHKRGPMEADEIRQRLRAVL